ncbi:hypothetical protein EDB82DRAFT_523486 [Fusarium venenatum]|uniref:uncharacterized protein n=1 Tax=Fusarium venenatum TaxID=56646 RepID=UPI001E00923B|nr:hypothetical protein EDB82DRAFT_523486 [Fusarium venenatum]
MAQVTGLDPEASVTSGNGASYPRTVPPGFSSPSASDFASASGSKRLNRSSYQNLPRSSSQFQTQARTRLRAKSASNLSARPSQDQDQDQDVRFNDDTFIGEKEDDGEPHDGIAELIDFLRNHSPPSGNFMSIPDDISPEDRGRWYRLRKLGKRGKSFSKSPQTIRLPDSAISGTTIGGHRHIAISIPLDASPFGRTPRSQYPVYQQRNARPLSSQYGPTRAVVNDKGVVTVLRTVKEDRETSPSVSPANSQLLLSSVPQGPSNTTTGGRFHPGTINSSNQTRSPEHSNVMATPPRVVSSEQVRQTNEQSGGFQNHEQGNTSATNPTQHERAPSRNSNSAGGRFVHLGDLSIDTMMSQPVTTDIKSESTSSARPVSRDGSYQHSLSKSIMTTSDNDPVVAEARPVEAKSVAARESRIRPPAKQSGEHHVTIITKSPLRVSRDYSTQKGSEESPSSSSKSPQNRRDKVRDKKKRDLEAASSKRRSMLVNTPEPKQESDQDTLQEMPEDDADEPPPVPLKSPQRQSICPIMVVANVTPSPPPSTSISTFPEKRDSADSETIKPLSKSKSGGVSFLIGDEDTASRPISPSPVSYMNGSPTPPQSARSSPTHEQRSQDRTSLSRRREWNAARDIERKRKEAASSSSPQPRARRATTGRDENDDKTTGAEVLRRYEAYREYRIREMERRVRRLERNGDVWLRALVPVLDNLNRTLASSQDDKTSKAQGWVSDDDDKSKSPKPSPIRPSSRGRMMTRAGTSEREFLEQLVKTREELEAGSISDDMSGFDTIEPLMRELAGRSRLSFEARSLGMDDEGLLQSLSH